jgi:hypothetical protein
VLVFPAPSRITLRRQTVAPVNLSNFHTAEAEVDYA